MKPLQKGFTLIELMITLAIVAILATIAYPAYTDYVIKSRRVDARSALITASQFLERNYSTQNTYLNTPLPPNMQCAPECGLNQTYVISISAITANNFTLAATAVGAQLQGENRLGCTILTIDNFGQKRPFSNAATPMNRRCW